MPRKTSQRLFEEFRQVGSDYSHKIEGTGIGLTLAKNFMELDGGTDLGSKRTREGLELQLYLAPYAIPDKWIYNGSAA